jgi:hypothetical protein
MDKDFEDYYLNTVHLDNFEVDSGYGHCRDCFGTRHSGYKGIVGCKK